MNKSVEYNALNHKIALQFYDLRRYNILYISKFLEEKRATVDVNKICIPGLIYFGNV